MYSVYKQGDNIQPWCTPFPIWTSLFSSVPFLVLTIASWPAYIFLRRQVRWSGIPPDGGTHQVMGVTISLRIFHSLLWSTKSRVWHSQLSRSRCFSVTPLIFHDPMDTGNLIAGSSAFSKFSLNIWKFTAHELLKPGLENFEHYFTSMWDEWNCAVVWSFLALSFFGIGMEADRMSLKVYLPLQFSGRVWVG